MDDQTAEPSTPPPLTVRACFLMSQIIAAMEPACLKTFKKTRHTLLRWQWDQKPSPNDIPEIMHFIYGTLYLGFVMDPFDPEDYADLKAINEEPIRMIDDMDLNDLRRYIHTLQRADKWSDGLWSPVLEALASGALQRAGQRLLDAPVSS